MSDRRVTNHSGRAHKSSGRVYNVNHNDRQFEHENNDLESQNVYWQCLQTDEIVTFKQCEREMYQQLYGEHLRKCNETAEKNRHADRIKTIDDYLESSAMAPEETLYYLGDKDHQVPTETLNAFARDMVEYIEKTFPQIKVLDYAIHRDEEGADHIHMRRTYMAYDKNGDLAPQQNKALEQMGIERPDMNQPRSRYNNNKQTFTAMERAYIKEWCLEHNIELTTEPPREIGKQGRDMQMFQFDQELEQTTDMLNKSRDALQQNKEDAIVIQQRIEQKREELERTKRQNDLELQKRERMGKTWLGKKKDRIEVNREEYEHVLEYCKHSEQLEHDLERKQLELERREQRQKQAERQLQDEMAQLKQMRDNLQYEINKRANERSKDKDLQIQQLNQTLERYKTAFNCPIETIEHSHKTKNLTLAEVYNRTIDDKCDLSEAIEALKDDFIQEIEERKLNHSFDLSR